LTSVYLSYLICGCDLSLSSRFTCRFINSHHFAAVSATDGVLSTEDEELKLDDKLDKSHVHKSVSSQVMILQGINRSTLPKSPVPVSIVFVDGGTTGCRNGSVRVTSSAKTQGSSIKSTVSHTALDSRKYT